METRAPGALPPRDSIRAGHQSVRYPSFRKVGLAAAVAVSIALLAIAVALVPRPAVAIEDVVFNTPGCMPAATSQGVRADFILVNRGGADATVRVNFLVDGTTATSEVFAVLKNARTPGQLETSVPNCSLHSYSLSMMYESYSGG